MKKIFYLVLLVPAILLSSCSKDSSDNTPTTYPVNGVWQYNYEVIDGVDSIALGYNTYLFIWEDDGIWGTEVYDINGFITDYSQVGTFTMSSNQQTAVFTIEGSYDSYNAEWIWLNTPIAANATIDKLDNDEMDFTITLDGSTQIVRSDLTTIALPNPFNNDNLQHRKNMLDKVMELKAK